MAKFFQQANGEVGLRKSALDESLNPIPGTATNITYFDENDPTNAATITAFNSNYASFAWVANVLKQNGVTVVFSPPLTTTTLRAGVFLGGLRLTADAPNSTVNLADVTGLGLPVAAGQAYLFEFEGGYTTAISTTGLQIALNGPAQVGLAARLQVSESATTFREQMVAAYDTVVPGINSGGSTALGWRIKGSFKATASGTLIPRFKSEVAGSAVTIKAGSLGTLYGVL